MIKAEIKGLDKLNNYLNQLQDKYGKDSMPRIIRSELIYVLNSLAKSEKKSKVSTLAEAGRRVGFNKASYNGLTELSINSGLRGGSKNLAWVRIKTKKGNKFLTAGLWDGNKSLEDNQWNYLINEGIASSKALEKLYKDSRGTTARNWYEMALKINEPNDIQPSVQDFVKKAKRKDGKPISISLIKSLTKNSYTVNGTIRSGILAKTGGQYRFDLALQKRSLFYLRALKKGWLDDAAFCKKYCAGITVNN